MVTLKEDSSLFKSVEQGAQQSRVDQDANYSEEYLNMAAQSAYAEIDKNYEQGGIRDWFHAVTVDRVGRKWSKKELQKNAEGSKRSEGLKANPELIMDKVRTKVNEVLGASETRLSTATTAGFEGLPSYTLNQQVLSATNHITRKSIFDIRANTLHSVASAKVHLAFLQNIEQEIQGEWAEHVALQNQLYEVVENSRATKILKATATTVGLAGGVTAIALSGGTALGVVAGLETAGLISAGTAGGATSLRAITGALAPSAKTQQARLDRFNQFDKDFQQKLREEFGAMEENLQIIRSKGEKGRDHMAQRVISRFKTGTEDEKDKIVEAISGLITNSRANNNNEIGILGINSEQEKIHLIEALGTPQLAEFQALINGKEFSKERFQRQTKETEVAMKHIEISKKAFGPEAEVSTLKANDTFSPWADLKIDTETKCADVPTLVKRISQELQRLKPNNTYEQEWFGDLLEADYLNDYGKFIVLMQKLLANQTLFKTFDETLRKDILIWFMVQERDLDPIVDDPNEKLEDEKFAKEVEEFTGENGLLKEMVILAGMREPKQIMEQWQKVDSLRNRYTSPQLETLLQLFKETGGRNLVINLNNFDTLYEALRKRSEYATRFIKEEGRLQQGLKRAERTYEKQLGQLRRTGNGREEDQVLSIDDLKSGLTEAETELEAHVWGDYLSDSNREGENNTTISDRSKKLETILGQNNTQLLEKRRETRRAERQNGSTADNLFVTRLNKHLYEQHHEELSQRYLERMSQQNQFNILTNLPEGATVTIDYLEVGPLTEIQVPEDFSIADHKLIDGNTGDIIDMTDRIRNNLGAAAPIARRNASGKAETTTFRVTKQCHKTGHKGTILETGTGANKKQIQIFSPAVQSGDGGMQVWKNAMIYNGENRPGTKAVAFNMLVS